MNIVLKELVNRVGLPADSLICAGTTYAGFGGFARLRLCGGSARHSNAGRLPAGSALAVRGYPSQYPCLREGLGYLRAPQLCVLGLHLVFIKYVHSITISLLLSLPFFPTFLICF